MPIARVRPKIDKKRQCPDTGACHHACPQSYCFRVEYCSPLGIAGFDNDYWPVEVQAKFGTKAADGAPGGWL